MIPSLASGFCVRILEKQVNSLVSITSISTEKDVLLDNFQGFFFFYGWVVVGYLKSFYFQWIILSIFDIIEKVPLIMWLYLQKQHLK